MTSEDQAILALCPQGWFKSSDLPYPRVQRADYRCERLLKAGKLETRVVGEFPYLQWEYRVLQVASPAAELKPPLELAKHLTVKPCLTVDIDRECNNAARAIVKQVEEETGKELSLTTCLNIVRVIETVATKVLGRNPTRDLTDWERENAWRVAQAAPPVAETETARQD